MLAKTCMVKSLGLIIFFYVTDGQNYSALQRKKDSSCLLSIFYHLEPEIMLTNFSALINVLANIEHLLQN